MARKPVEIRGKTVHFDFEGLSCCGCGKALEEENVYTIEVPMLPKVVTEENLFCSGCAVAVVRENGGTTHKVLPPKKKLGDGVHETGDVVDGKLYAHGEGTVSKDALGKAAKELSGEAAHVAEEKAT